MSSDMYNREANDLRKLALRSKVSALVSLLGLAILIGSLVFGALRLSAVDSEVLDKTNELRRLEAEKASMEQVLSELYREFETVDSTQASQAIDRALHSTSPYPYVAIVDAPVDGWLALRGEASTQFGGRIIKIPHGSRVEVTACQDESSLVGRVPGRWCRVRYQSLEGWAFDAYMLRTDSSSVAEIALTTARPEVQ